VFDQLRLLAPGVSLGRFVFEARFVHVEFAMDKVVLEQVSLRVLRTSHDSIVPPFANNCNY